MRVRKKAWAPAEIASNDRVIKNPQEWKGRWAEYFGNDNPIYIEIGCGKGQFISKNAAQYSEINFIGIEKEETVVGIAARKLPEGANNVVLIHGDVANIHDFFAVGELKRLYINFCDPWPKKRAAKRRLTHEIFLESYKKLFGDYAEVFFKTDNRDLFEFSLNSFCGNNWKLSNISLDLHHSDFEGNIMTEYEEKFSNEGFPIYRLEARWHQ